MNLSRSRVEAADLVRHSNSTAASFYAKVAGIRVYVNWAAHGSSTVPRHREINDYLAGYVLFGNIQMAFGAARHKDLKRQEPQTFIRL